jgi:hypothetical protein
MNEDTQLNLVTSQRLDYNHCIRSQVATRTHCVRGWVDPMTGLEVVAETNTSDFVQIQTLDLPLLTCQITDSYIKLHYVVESFICFAFLVEINCILKL